MKGTTSVGTEEEVMLTLSEAASMLRCHPNTVRAWVRQGRLDAVPMGPRKVNMYRKADVKRLRKPLEKTGVIIKEDKQAFPVVGIGASAGGLDAITRLLKHLPTDLGLAYVLVSHQEKGGENRLFEVLRTKTSLPVIMVENGMRLEPDRLYLVPGAMNAAVVDGTFTLREPRGRLEFAGRPIDAFFTALAHEYQNNAIGVVLSGRGIDGTEGLRAIKAEDGLTVVQDDTAQETSMPRSAQEAEVVDLVRRPEDIGPELAGLVKELFPGGRARIPAKQENELRRILQYVLEQRGVDFTEYKENTIHRRIIRRMVLSKCAKLSEYNALLRGIPSELDTLFNDLLINVTSFFRDPAFHKALNKLVLPKLFEVRPATEPLRIWVPACAGGEEVVSIAITLLEFVGERSINTPVQIFATDLNERTIEKARLGIYKKSALQNLSPARVSKFFTVVDGHYQVIKPIRDMCVYAKHDLLKDPPFSRLDLISCQNVLIYLESPAQARILKSFHYALRPHGFLAIGRSETPDSAGDLFQQPDKVHKVYSKKRGASERLQMDLSFKPALPVQQHAPSISTWRQNGSRPDMDREVELLLLHRYVPASVLVNKDLEIVRFMGPTAPFLAPSAGRATLSLLKMVRDDLAYELRSLLKKARSESIPMRKGGIPMHLNNALQNVSLEVVPCGGRQDPHFLVLFREEGVPVINVDAGAEHANGSSIEDARERRIAVLEQELLEAREHLRLVSEDAEVHVQHLQAANEEVVSSNEELQSINEELETSKEELQSINEEFATINEELQSRNDALHESQERLDLATHTGKVGIWDWEVATDRLSWSDSLYTMHGIKPGNFDASMDGYKALLHPGDRERFMSTLAQAMKFEDRFELEVRALRPKGEVIWMFTIATILRVDGKAVRVMGASVDITERRAVEEALQQRTNALELLNAMGDTLIAELDTRKIVQAVTDTGRAVVGAEFGAFFYNVTDEKGASFMLYTLSGIPREAFDHMPMPRATEIFGPTFRGEGVVRSGDITKDPRYGKMDPHRGMPKGHPPVRSYLAVPVTSRDGRVIGGLFFGHHEADRFTSEAEELVTPLAAQAALALDNADLHNALQRELEQQRLGAVALAESESRYRQLIDTLPAAVFTCDTEGRVLLYNEAAKALWGSAPAGSPGIWHGAHRLYTPDGRELEPDESPMARAIRQGAAIREEMVIQRPDGTRRHVLAHPEPVRDADGTVVGGHNVLIDITDRYNAEAERQQLSGMIERSLNEIYIFDLKSLKFEYVNHGALKNLGFTLDQMREMTPVDIKPEYDAQAFDRVVEPLRNGEKEKLVFHTVHRRADGSDYPVEVHLQTVNSGTRRLFMAMILDITERKLGEERLRVATETGKLGIWDWDVEKDTITWTDPVYAIHGVKKGSFEPTIDGYSELIHPEDREWVTSAIRATLEDGAPYEVEFRTLNPEGEVNWVFTNAVVLREQGRPVRMMGGTMNITSRKRTEVELAQSEERFKTIYEKAPFGVMLYSADEARIIDVNPAMLQMIGRSRKAVIGRTSVEIGMNPDAEQRQQLLAMVQRTGHLAPVEMELRHADGHALQVQVNADIVQLGGVPYILAVLEDITERKAASMAIGRLAAIVESSDDAIISRDLQGTITTWNQGAERIFGYSPEEMIGKRVTMLFPPDRLNEEEQLVKRLLKGERIEHFETVRVHKDGSPVDISLILSPMKDAQGRVIGVSKVIRDITEQKRNREAIAASEERFHLVADNVYQLIWIAEADGSAMWFNQRWTEFTGKTGEEIRADGRSIHHPDHFERVTNSLTERAAKGESWEDSFPLLSKTGQYHWFLATAMPIRNDEGTVVRWFGTCTDITTEREAQDRIRESEERFRMLADHMSQMAYMVDPCGTVTWVNQRWLEYTGLSKEQMNQGGWEQVVHLEHLADMIATYAKAQETGTVWQYVFQLKGRTGEYRWFLARSVPIFNEEGKVERWFGTNTDITEQKLAEEALEESSRHKDHFLATLAHELRNPLAPLKNGLQLMELAPDDPSVINDTRGMMTRQLDHMVRLVDDLMDLSRISRGKLELIKGPTELSSVLDTAIEATKPLMDRKEQDFQVNIVRNDLVVNGDQARLTQVVVNLLNNAAKYTPSRGRISLTVDEHDGEAVITVKDNGIGIDPSALEHVFDMFAQVEGSHNDHAAGGLGIGLNIVRRLVHMHHGSVVGHSDGVGHGSEFEVRLPLMRKAGPARSAPSKGEHGGNTGGGRVLVVDDNQDAALTMALILRKLGHEVKVAHDGEQALDAGAAFLPDLILMDIGMPKLNGHEACVLMRKTPWGRKARIVALSGWGQDEDRKRSMEAGFDTHVVKPIERSTLMDLADRSARE